MKIFKELRMELNELSVPQLGSKSVAPYKPNPVAAAQPNRSKFMGTIYPEKPKSLPSPTKPSGGSFLGPATAGVGGYLAGRTADKTGLNKGGFSGSVMGGALSGGLPGAVSGGLGYLAGRAANKTPTPGIKKWDGTVQGPTSTTSAPKPQTQISPSLKKDLKDPMALTNLDNKKPLVDPTKKPITFDKMEPKKPSPTPVAPKVSSQPKQSSYSDFMKDLKASAEKMRSTTSDMASKTGAMKQAASNFSGSFNGDLSSKISKPVTPGGMSSSDVSKKASSIGASEFKPGSIAAKFPDTAKFPNTGTFKKVSDLNPTGI